MRTTHSAGFTVIETLITVIVASLFIITLNLLYAAVVRDSTNVRNQADASDLAYSKLRNYVYNGAKVPSTFVCQTGSTSNDDLIANPSATGQSITGKVSVGSASTALPQPVYYEVVAKAIYGCSGANVGTPILLQSTVTYGQSNRTIVHAGLVNF